MSKIKYTFQKIAWSEALRVVTDWLAAAKAANAPGTEKWGAREQRWIKCFQDMLNNHWGELTAFACAYNKAAAKNRSMEYFFENEIMRRAFPRDGWTGILLSERFKVRVGTYTDGHRTGSVEFEFVARNKAEAFDKLFAAYLDQDKDHQWCIGYIEHYPWTAQYSLEQGSDKRVRVLEEFEEFCGQINVGVVPED